MDIVIKKNGKIVCNKCNGRGHLATFENKPDYRVNMTCLKCNGDGELDFIENIVGKKNNKLII